MKQNLIALSASAAVVAITAGFANAQAPLSPDRQYGINIGQANISPYVHLGYFYDDNPDFVRKGEKGGKFGTSKDYDSWGYNIRPGVDLKIPGNDVNLTGNAFYSMERYEKDFVEERNDWGESLALTINCPRDLDFRLNQLYKFVHEEDDEAARWDDRQELGFGGSVHKGIGEKTDVTLRGSYKDLDYDSEALNDRSSYTVGAVLSRAVTEKMNAKVTGHYTGSESEKQDGTADTWTALVGVSSRATEKITYDLNVGYHLYTGFGDDDDESTVAYDGSIHWAATDKFGLRLSGSSEFHPSEDEDDNSIRSYRAALSAHYRPVERWLFTARLGYTDQDYTKPVKTGPNTTMGGVTGLKRHDRLYSTSLGAAFALAKFASINGNFTYSFDDSSIEAYEYDRWRATLGLTLRY